MSADPSESDREAVAAYKKIKEDATKYCLHHEFAEANEVLDAVEDYEVPTAALYSYLLTRHATVEPYVMDDLDAFFHRHDGYISPMFVEGVFDTIAAASFVPVTGISEAQIPAVSEDAWPTFVKTVKEQYAAFTERSRVHDSETRMAFRQTESSAGDFLYYLRLAQKYKGDVAPGLTRHLAHRLMYVARSKYVPYRSAHWGFLDAYEWGRMEAMAKPGEFDLVAWEKHVAEMEALYEKLPHPEKVIESQYEKAGIERLRAERDVHGNPPELTTPENPCGYTPSQLEHLNKHHS